MPGASIARPHFDENGSLRAAVFVLPKYLVPENEKQYRPVKQHGNQGRQAHAQQPEYIHTTRRNSTLR
jgi:hypothetical protein